MATAEPQREQAFTWEDTKVAPKFKVTFWLACPPFAVLAGLGPRSRTTA